MAKPCPCGSGKERFDLTDSAGIFCCFICDDCEAEKVARYNPAIFEDSSRYAVTGDEEDIGSFDDGEGY
jgi:hypothetical protein